MTDDSKKSIIIVTIKGTHLVPADVTGVEIWAQIHDVVTAVCLAATLQFEHDSISVEEYDAAEDGKPKPSFLERHGQKLRNEISEHMFDILEAAGFRGCSDEDVELAPSRFAKLFKTRNGELQRAADVYHERADDFEAIYKQEHARVRAVEAEVEQQKFLLDQIYAKGIDHKAQVEQLIEIVKHCDEEPNDTGMCMCARAISQALAAKDERLEGIKQMFKDKEFLIMSDEQANRVNELLFPDEE